MSKTTFFKDLGKRDKKHLAEMGMQTLGAFRRNAEEQRQMRLAHPESEPCFECKAIARKLGVAV